MYATCLYCRGALGGNQSVEAFPVGRRLAFDAKNGRLWVVCPACGRWNLTPLEERWDAIETCERLFRATRLRVTTTQIGMARLPEGTVLVRIGAPLRPEFAAWRYGTRLVRRRNRARVVAGGAALAAGAGAVAFAPLLVPALAMGAFSIIALPGVTTVMGMVPVVGALALRDYLAFDRVVGRLRRGRRVITVRVRHAAAAELRVVGDDQPAVSLDIPHDGGWAHFDGLDAMQAAGTVLAGTNRYGAPQAQVQDAVRCVEEFGDAATYLRAASTLGGARHMRLISILNLWRGLGTMRLSATECLALEMALHEESERRALEGELALLEAAWREAEELARVADAL